MSLKNWHIAQANHSMASDFIRQYHYAKSVGRVFAYVHGLYSPDWQLMGVAWWMPPPYAAAVKYSLTTHQRVLMLSRLCVHPDTPKNSASYLLGGSVRMIRHGQRFDSLISYADTWQNHEGKIYQATNWQYAGQTAPARVYVDSAGATHSCKVSAGGTRNRAQMEALGYRLVGSYPRHVYRLVFDVKYPEQLRLL